MLGRTEKTPAVEIPIGVIHEDRVVPNRESLEVLRKRLSGDPMDALATVQDGAALAIVFNELLRFGFTETAAEVFLVSLWKRGVQVTRRHG